MDTQHDDDRARAKNARQALPFPSPPLLHTFVLCVSTLASWVVGEVGAAEPRVCTYETLKLVETLPWTLLAPETPPAASMYLHKTWPAISHVK